MLTLPETNSKWKHLKMDWNTTFLLGPSAYFQGLLLLVLGRVNKFVDFFFIFAFEKMGNSRSHFVKLGDHLLHFDMQPINSVKQE